MHASYWLAAGAKFPGGNPLCRYKIGRAGSAPKYICHDQHGHIECSPELVSASFEKLRDNHFVRWLRYGTSESCYYVWVIENAGGHTHVHWVLHLPKLLRALFDTKLPEWVARVAGTIACRDSAIKIKPVTNLPGLGRYLMKGMDPRYAPRCGVRHIPQGLVYSKRCGISKSLGPASRTGLRPSAGSGFNPDPTLRST